MRTQFECTATSLGYKAWETCTVAPLAKVIGVTSRGLFLLAPPQHIVFVSFEARRSPLTIALDRSCDQLRAIEVGATAQLSAARLIFPSIGVAISLSAEVVWRCPLPVSTPRSRTEQRRALRTIAQAVLARKDGGWASLLPRLLELPAALQFSTEDSARLEKLIALRQAIQTGDDQQMITGLIGLLGQGRGLTPSGDDVVIGLLLMLNRWHADRDWTAVNRAVIEAAYRVTTDISANLIECAAAGQGDERLITVVDGLAAGSTSIDECVECALGWGSSSGVDALVGMTIAICGAGC